MSSAALTLRFADITPFGLGTVLWINGLDRARRLTRETDADAVFLNGVVVSDPRRPFGGINAPGCVRESSRMGWHEFTNPKTVWTRPSHN